MIAANHSHTWNMSVSAVRRLWSSAQKTLPPAFLRIFYLFLYLYL